MELQLGQLAVLQTVCFDEGFPKYVFFFSLVACVSGGLGTFMFVCTGALLFESTGCPTSDAGNTLHDAGNTLSCSHGSVFARSFATGTAGEDTQSFINLSSIFGTIAGTLPE